MELIDCLEKYRSVLSKQPLAIAVSGGVDSMVLTHLLVQCGYDFTGLHCNFNLRKASKSDAAFVQEQFNKLDRPLQIKSFDTQQEQFSDETTQMAARRLRYQWFKEWQKTNDGLVLMAHHLNDRIETFWLNINRGTSIFGLQGMPEQSNGFIRPLLDLSKRSLIDYSFENKVAFVEDESNTEDLYTRNWIRHHFVNEFSSITNEEWRSFFDRQNKINSWFESKIKRIRKHFLYKTEDGRKVDKKLFELPWIWVYHVLKPYGLKRKHESIIRDLLLMERGKKLDFEGFEWFLEQKHVLISFVKQTIQVNAIEIGEFEGEVNFGNSIIKYGLCSRTDVDYKNNRIVYFDAGKVNFPIQIRSFQPGDRMQPLGMQGQKKVSDLINDLKVSTSEKKFVPILVIDLQVVCVLPHRIAEQVKIEDQTKKVMYFQVQNLEL